MQSLEAVYMHVCSVLCSGLEITYQGIVVKGNTMVIKDIVALGSLSSNLGKVIIADFVLGT